MACSNELSLYCLTGALTYFSFAVILSLYDAWTGLLPDKLTLSFLWLGLLFHCLVQSASVESAIYGAISGYLSLWLLYWVFFWCSNKEGLGYGDFKLLAAIGAWNGWQSLALILVIASCAGMMTFAVLRIMKHPSIRQLPFGPYLAMTGWGEFIWQFK